MIGAVFTTRDATFCGNDEAFLVQLDSKSFATIALTCRVKKKKCDVTGALAREKAKNE